MSLTDYYKALNLPGEIQSDDTPAAILNLTQAAPLNPDEEANKIKLQRATGTPANLMADKEVKASAERQAYLNSLDLSNSPATAKFFAVPENANVAHDQYKPLGAVEWAARNFASGFLGTGIGSTIRGTGDILHALEQLTQSKSIAADSLTSFGKNVEDFYKFEDSSTVGQTIQGLGQIVPQIAAGVASGPLAPFTVGAMMTAQGSAQMADKIAQDKKAQETDKNIQALEVLSGGLITGATEALTTKLFLSAVQKAALRNTLLARAGAMALGGASESVQEFSENILQDVTHIALTNRESKIGLMEAVQAGTVGGLVGSIASAVLQGALHIRVRGD